MHGKNFHLVYKYLQESQSDEGKGPMIVVDDARDGAQCLGGVAEMGRLAGPIRHNSRLMTARRAMCLLLHSRHTCGDTTFNFTPPHTGRCIQHTIRYTLYSTFCTL